MTASTAIQAIVSGLATGSVYGLVAMGFALTYGATRMMSIAHGDVVGSSLSLAIAAVLGTSATVRSSSVANDVLLVLGTVALSTAMGLGLYFVAIRPFLLTRRAASSLSAGRALMGWVAVGAAAGLLLRAVIGATFNRGVVAVPDALHLGWFSSSGVVTLPGNAQVPARLLGVVVVGLALALGTDQLIQRSSRGLAIQAVSSDPGAAGLVGIAAGRVLPLAFAGAGALAGVAGLLGLPGTAVTASTGVVIGLKAIAAALLWRLGSPRTAFLGGLAIGVAEALAVAAWGAGLADVFALGLLVALLATRPSGLASRARPEHV